MLLTPGPLTVELSDRFSSAIYLRAGHLTLATVWGHTEASCLNASLMANASRLYTLVNEYRAAANESELTAAHEEADALLASMRAEYERLRVEVGERG